jgi:protein-disulfide isomerase
MSTRKAIQEKRRRDQQRQRMRSILIIGGVAVLVVAFLVFLNFRPVGNIAQPPERPHPNADGVTLGDPDAPVVLEEFADFQCPTCRSWLEAIEPEVIENYVTDGQVYFVFRHFPILGPESLAAANASMCANEQGEFWSYHDVLFANQVGNNAGGFSDRRLEAFAETLGLDVNAFSDCLADARYESAVSEDFQRGQELGVPGTPGIVINGVLLEDFSFASISQQVDAILATQ